MRTSGEDAKLLRIFLGESCKSAKTPVYEQIVLKAKQQGLAGATVYKGIMGFGKNSLIRTAKVLTISEDLPVVVEIVDKEDKISDFIPVIDAIIEESGCGGMITIEKAEIIRYS